MKKITFIILCVIAVLSGFSQKRGKNKNVDLADTASPQIRILKEPSFMLNLHAAYAVGMGSTFKFYPDDISSIDVSFNGPNAVSKNVIYTNPTKGLGDGFKFGFGGSYILNDFINIGLDFDYFNSTIKKNRDSAFRQFNGTIGNNGADEYSYKERNTISYQATLLSLTPNITFKAISRPKWFIYNKLGAVITFRPNSQQEDVTTVNTSTGWMGFYKDSTSTTIKKYEWGIRNPAFGFMGAIGVQFKITDRLRFYAEAQFSHIVFIIRKRTLTDFIVDNRQLRNSMPLSVRELDFVKSYSNSVVNTDPDKPSQTIIQRIPITYLGLQAGLAYQF